MSDFDFDARIERLTERHEALAQSIELLTHDIREMKAAMQETNAAMVRMDARERIGRAALLQGITAYLQALDGDGPENVNG
jgi:chromosome segregation ATPase